MTRIRLALAATMIVAATAAAQTEAPIVKQTFDGVTAKIAAANIPSDMKDYFTQNLKTVYAARISQDDKIQQMQRVQTDLVNSEAALRNWEKLNKEITDAPNYHSGLRTKFLNQAMQIRVHYIPQRYNDSYNALQAVRRDFLNYGSLSASVNAFTKQVQDDPKVPAPLKAATLRTLGTMIDGFPTNLQSDNSALENEKTRFNRSMDLVRDMDTFAAEVRRDVPAGYATFRDNTINEVTAYREGVGKDIGRENLTALQRLYRERLSWVKDLATCQAKINALPNEQRAAFQTRYNKIAPPMLTYHGGAPVDPDGLRRLLADLTR